MVKIGNGVWKLDETSELAQVLRGVPGGADTNHAKNDEVTRIPGVIFAVQSSPVTLPAAIQKGHL